MQYARLEDARAAQQSLNGLELAGRPIKVRELSFHVDAVIVLLDVVHFVLGSDDWCTNM